jgi:HK97 gp10 family phage protein
MSLTSDRASIGAILSGLRRSKVVDIEGIDALYDNMERIVGNTGAEKLKPVFFDAGAALRDQAKNNAPYDPRRKEGYHLREAIFCAPGQKGEPNVLVGVSRSRRKRGKPSAPHGILVEYGTARMQAQPFFRPAIAQTTAKMRDIIVTGIDDAIQGALK